MTASEKPGLTCDKILKNILSNSLCISQLLQSFICRPEMSDFLDCDHIRQLGTEYIDSSTQNYYYGDMLWEIACRNKTGQPLYLVLLLELQSRSCRHMALRMSNYATQFYLRLLRNSADSQPFPLPQVLPVVFYTGWKVWRGPTDVCDLIDGRGVGLLDEEPFYRFRFKLLDIPRIANAAEKNSLIWLLVDCLQTNDIDKLLKKWQNLKSVLPDLGHPDYQEAWIQLFGMVYHNLRRNLKEDDMSTDISWDTTYPHYTLDELDDRFDAEGNMISSARRMFILGKNEGKAEGKAEGRIQALTASMRNLTETLGLSVQEAMNALRIPESERAYYLDILSH